MADSSEPLPQALAGERLDRAVCIVFGLARSAAARAVREGRVRLGGRAVLTPSARVRAGDVLAVEPEAPLEEAGQAPPQLRVVYEDESIVVVDKEAGVVMHPGAGRSHGTASQALLARYPEIASVGDPQRPGIVHRLDKGTSGLFVAARTQVAYESLVAQMRLRQVRRSYLAVVAGRIEEPAGKVDAPIARSRRQPTRMTVSRQGREARSSYVVRERLEAARATLVEVTLETGRTHQIRVHMSAIGHPVIGDSRYGGANPLLERPFLHAWSLSLAHPLSGEPLSWESELPEELLGVLEALRGAAKGESGR